MLHKASALSEKIALVMVAMAGFCNVAIHEYQGLDMSIVHAIARDEWKSLIIFCAETGSLIRH